MPKIASLQSNFNAGEVSQLVYARTESPRYKQGLETGLNYIPTLQGPLVRRPGTKFMNAVKDSTKPPILIPFQFSITQAYILEFGDKYIRFYANNGQVVTSANTVQILTIVPNSGANSQLSLYATIPSTSPNPYGSGSVTGTILSGQTLELPTNYSYTDLSKLKWTQSADTLYLFHPNYPTAKLQRIGQTYWVLSQVYFQDGPYLPLNSHSAPGDSTSITLTYNTLPSGLGSGLATGPVYTVSVTANNGAGAIRLTTSTAHNFVNGQRVYVSGTATTADNDFFKTLSGNYYWTVNVISTTQVDLAGSTYVSAAAAGTIQPALFSNTDVGFSTLGYQRTVAVIIGGIRYWGQLVYKQVTGPTYSSNAAQTPWVQDPTQKLTSPLALSASPATAWQEGVYSEDTGFPACGTFHQNRLALSGVTNYPQEIDFSFTGQYENFAASLATTLAVAASNAIQFTLNSSDVNAIRWLRSTTQGLLAGSSSSEWAMSPSSQGEALTPTNFNAVQTSFFGSADVDSILMGNAALYIQRAGRKLREMQYFFQVGSFRSTDLTEICEHITLPTITRLSLQKETQPLLWATRSDGALLSMIYNRDDASLSAGWTRHILGGQSDNSGTQPIVQSIAVIPSPNVTFDQLWMTVKRYINGATIVAVEYMTKIYDDSILQEDAFQFDCGGTYDLPITISGISIASPCVVTATAHGMANGQRVRIVGVAGLSKSSVDVNGITTYINLVNETTFIIANVTANTFSLQDFVGNNISSIGYGAYVSGGQVRKMVTTISGLTWLENETVSILADGGIHPDVVVSNAGVITLNYPVAKVQIGYKYNSDGKLLRVEGGAADGTSIGKTRRTTRAALMLHNVGQIQMGTSFNKLIDVKFPQADNQLADEATPLYSGVMRDGLESNYDFESQICFRQNSGLPGMIQGIVSFMEEQDV